MKKIVLCLFVVILISGCTSKQPSQENVETPNINESKSSPVVLKEKIKQARLFEEGLAFVLTKDEVWKCINKKGEVIFTLDIGSVPQTSYVDGLAGISGQNGYYLIDKSGNEHMVPNLEENEIIKAYFNMDGKGEIWTEQIVDTANEHCENVRIRDSKGNLIYSFEKGENFPKGPLANFYVVGDGVYELNNSPFVLDYKNDKTFKLNLRSTNRNKKSTHIDFSREKISSFESDDGEMLVNRDLQEVITFGKGNKIGLYSDAAVYVEGNNRKGFYDQTGNLLVDMSNYNIWGGISPYFMNGYAAIEFMNPNNVSFITVINKKGEQLFEPVKGKFLEDMYNSILCFEDGKAIVSLDGQGIFLINPKGEKLVKIPSLGYIDDRNDESIILWNQGSDPNEDEYYYVDYDGNLLFQELPNANESEG